MLVDVQIASGYLGVIQYVRIGLGKVAGRCDHELLGVLVKQDLGPVAERLGRMERRDRVLVLLAVGKLFLDLSYRRTASLAEPGRKLGCAVFAEITVLELPVAEQADLLSAYITEFLGK